MQKLPGTLVSSNSFDSFILQDDRAYCDLDRRFGFASLGSSGAQLPIVRIERISALPQTQRAVLGVEGVGDTCTLIGGGVTNAWSSAWTDPMSFEQRGRLLSPFVRAAAKDAIAADGVAIAPSVGAVDLATFADVPDASVSVIPTEPHYVLELKGSTTLDEFLAGLTKRGRQTWRHDLATSTRNDVHADVADFLGSDATEISHAVADTSTRNGFIEHPILAEWRISGFTRRPGHHRIARIYRAGECAAYALWTWYGTSVIAHTFAMVDDAEDRQNLYHVAYKTCLSDALEGGAAFIRFGPRHATPKKARGCVTVPRWRVSYSDGASVFT